MAHTCQPAPLRLALGGLLPYGSRPPLALRFALGLVPGWTWTHTSKVKYCCLRQGWNLPGKVPGCRAACRAASSAGGFYSYCLSPPDPLNEGSLAKTDSIRTSSLDSYSSYLPGEAPKSIGASGT